MNTLCIDVDLLAREAVRDSVSSSRIVDIQQEAVFVVVAGGKRHSGHHHDSQHECEYLFHVCFPP
jgi:hypothetical protein